MESTTLTASPKFLTTNSNRIEDVARNLSLLVKGWSFEDALNYLQPSIDEADLRTTLENCGVYYD